MHAHVERRDALIDESLKALRPQVGQRDVAAVRERESEIVVPEPKRRAGPLRIPVDEAEHALVGALANRIRSRDDPDRVARLPLDLVEYLLAIRGDRLEFQIRVREQEGEVDPVPDRFAVDANDPSTDLETELIRDAAGFDFCDAYHGRYLEIMRKRAPGWAEKLTRRGTPYNL